MAVPHYRLHGYLARDGDVTSSPLLNWATPERIFFHRPNQHRYAAVFDGSKYQAWDFFDVWWAAMPLESEPPARWTSPSLDGLIMTALTLYEET